jgi:Zn-dependent protease/predicted transcriptional regulator
MSGVPVARIFGIEIRIHVSWIFIIAIITVTVGGQLNLVEPGAGPLMAWVVGAISSLGFLLTVVIHELAHALVGRRMGNPVDAISVHFVGSPSAVDVQATSARAEIAIAFAGPLTSLAISVLLILASLGSAAVGGAFFDALADLTFIIGGLDLVLGLISLIPAFPLDGGRIVRGIVWRRTGDDRRGTRAAGQVGRWAGRFFLGAGLAVILTGNTIDGAMLGLAGWFLMASARSVDRWVVLDRLITGVRVGEAMEADFESVSPQLTLDTFARSVLDGTVAPALAVLRDEKLVGMIGADQLRGVPQKDWPSTRIADVMIDAADVPHVEADDLLSIGLDRLRDSHLDGLPVLDATGLRGVMTRRSIAAMLRARAELNGVVL